jgi:signal transduction histidine kinase
LAHTPQGGRITVSAERRDGKIAISVADTGSGIPPQYLPLIFDRFYRADPSRSTDTGASGLGLAIVKALVEAQGGRVWAESVEGKGTSFFMEFPVNLPG